MDLYPQKPELTEHKMQTNLGATIFSIVIFALIFMLLFSNELDLIIGFVVVLLLRELGRFFVMKHYKYKHIRLLFIPLMGAFIHGKKDLYSQLECLMVVAWALFPGIVIGFFLMLLSQNAHSIFLFQIGMLMFLINIVNLFPLDPLDGGQLFKLIVRKTHEKWMLYLTLFFSVSIIVLGFYFSNYLLTLFGFLMAFRVRNLQKTYHLHREFSEESLPFHTKYKDLSNQHFWRMKEILIAHRPALKQYLQYADASETDVFIASQINAVLVSPIQEDSSWWMRFCIVMLWLLSLVSPFLLWYYIDLNWMHYAVGQLQFF